MKNRIYFFANFGDWNKVPYGGGEVGNRRTLNLLKKAGFDVVTIPKYLRVTNHSIKNLCILGYRIFFNLYSYFWKLLWGTRKKSIVHVVGFYGPMIYFEYILILLAKILRYRIVYEMRGGGADVYYNGGSTVYRFIFRKALVNVDIIFTQGLENIPLFKTISPSCKYFYYPNYVTNDFFPITYPIKSKEFIRFIYFGRISPTKNIDIVVDTFIRLSSKYANLTLDIVGNCTDGAYLESIKNRIMRSGYANRVKIWAACNHEQLKEYLVDKHFYMFPSTEPHEGHSNALTEAMAWGLIPIATSQGFNRSVIGDDDLIVKDLSVDEFVARISAIIDNDKIEELSRKMYLRIKENYTDEIIYQSLKNEYIRLFSLYF